MSDEKYMKNYLTHLPKNQKLAIQRYTGSAHDYINEYLAKGARVDPLFVEAAELIDEVFKFAPKVVEPFTVYRGIDSEMDEDYFKTYASTSLDKKIALDFVDGDCCLLNITVASGSKALPIHFISTYQEEDEILLDRGGYMVVNNVEFVEESTDLGLEEVKTYFCTYFAKKPKEIRTKSDLKTTGKDLEKDNVHKKVANFLHKSSRPCDDITIKRVFKLVANRGASGDDIEQVKALCK